MNPRLTAPVAIAALALSGSLALAAHAQRSAVEGKWIHVRIDGTSDETGQAELVRINLPLSMMAKALPLLKEEAMKEGGGQTIEIGEQDYDLAQLRALWEAAKETGDAEFVTVQSGEESIHVARSGGHFLVTIRGNSKEIEGAASKPEAVDVKIPLDVVDALLSGSGQELNFEAAIEALARHTESDLILVNDGSDRIRIWVDSKNAVE